MPRFHCLEHERIGIDPEVAGSPRQRMPGRPVSIYEQLPYNPPCRRILLAALVISQPGAQLNGVTFRPAVRRSGT